MSLFKMRSKVKMKNFFEGLKVGRKKIEELKQKKLIYLQEIKTYLTIFLIILYLLFYFKIYG